MLWSLIPLKPTCQTRPFLKAKRNKESQIHHLICMYNTVGSCHYSTQADDTNCGASLHASIEMRTVKPLLQCGYFPQACHGGTFHGATQHRHSFLSPALTAYFSKMYIDVIELLQYAASVETPLGIVDSATFRRLQHHAAAQILKHRNVCSMSVAPRGSIHLLLRATHACSSDNSCAVRIHCQRLP